MGARKTNALSDAIISKLSRRKGKFKVADGDGLYLEFNNPNGTPTWRMRFRANKMYQRATLGRFPEMSLAEARAARARFRKDGAKTVRPTVARPAIKQVAKVNLNPGNDLGRIITEALAAAELLLAMNWRWDGAKWVPPK